MGGKTSREDIVNETNKMVANVFVNIALYCSQDTSQMQSISVQCNPFAGTTQGTVAYEDNPTCKACIKNLVDLRLQEYAIQERAWARGAQPKMNKPINEDYIEMIQGFVNCGKTACKACVVENVSQKSIVKSVLSCNAMNNVKNQVDQQILASLTQKLENRQDMLSAIAKVTGARSAKEVIINTGNRISVKLTENVISAVENQISSNQTVNIIGSGSGGINVNGMTQNQAINSVMNFFTKNQMFNTIFTDAEFKAIENLIDDTDTIGDAGQILVGSLKWFDKTIKSYVGILFIAILSVIGFLFFVICTYVSVKLIQKSINKNKYKEEEFQRTVKNKSVFKTF